MGRWRRLAERLRVPAVIGLGLFLGLQVLPVGPDPGNPPVTARPPWSSEAEAVFERSCAACHSNETRWPWYSHVAPASWLVRRDVAEGRHELNVSRWERDDGEADDAVEAIVDGTMPPRRYLLMHPSARLTDEERRVLADALRRLDGDG